MKALLLQHPELREIAVSIGILAGSYLGARLASFAFARILSRAAARKASSLGVRLVAALKRPFAYALFLAGVWGALHRLPLPERLAARLDAGLLLLAVLVAALALLRAYTILVSWYTIESRAAHSDGLMAELGPLAQKLGVAFIVLMAAITGLQQLGINVASLVVSLGVGSLAIGLAAQDTLSNMFAGFTLMLDRPFRIGDRIQLATGEVGDVETIGMRATRIRTLDDTLLVVPNSLLIKDRVTNQSRPGRTIATRVELGVAYGSDLAQVRGILTEAVLAAPHVDHDRPPVVTVARFAEFSVALQVGFWARDYMDVVLARSEVLEQIHRRLAEAGIEIPVPVRRILAGAAPGGTNPTTAEV